MIAKNIAKEIVSRFVMRRGTAEYQLLSLALQQAAALPQPYPTFKAFCQTLAGPAQKPNVQSIQRTLARAVRALYNREENHALLDELYGCHLSESPSAKDFIYTAGSYIQSVAAKKQARKKSSIQDIYQQYVHWACKGKPLSFSEFEHQTAASEDVFEDERYVVTRLFYLIPDSSKKAVRCFVFYEENTFRKDKAGDLHVVRSRYYRDMQQT